MTTISDAVDTVKTTGIKLAGVRKELIAAHDVLKVVEMNYEKVQIESSEYDTIEECREEIAEAILSLEKSRPDGVL